MGTYDIRNDTPENVSDFLIWRARAIEAYAQVEQSLNMLFAQLMETPIDSAAIVFFRITNKQSRNAIISELLTRRHEKQYEVYWHGTPGTANKRGLMTLVRQLDSRRNEIVHWHTGQQISVDDEKAVGKIFLRKPNFWTYKSDRSEISAADLQEFHAKAGFVAKAINIFTMNAHNLLRGDSPAKPTWREICQQPCIYPPPDNHPLALKPGAPENPPQSSGE